MPIKNIFVFVVTLFLFVLFLQPTFANLEDPDLRAQLSTSEKTVSDEVRIAACKRISESVKEKTLILEENRDIHINNYASLKRRLKTIATELSLEGFNTLKLSEDINKFDTLVIEYRALFDELLRLLRESNEGVCTKDGQGLRIELQYAKDQLIGLVRKRHEIRVFYKDNIREDIADLREQAKEMNLGKEANE